MTADLPTRTSQDNVSGEPPQKRSRHSETISPAPADEASSENKCGSENKYGPEVRWEEYFGSWPSSVEQKSVSKRRSQTSPQSNGERVWDEARRLEENMEEAGLFMRAPPSEAVITDDCQRLCCRLLEAKYEMPQEGPHYQRDLFAVWLRRLQFRNRAALFKHVTPFLVPSAELHNIFELAQLDNVREAVKAEWTDCSTMGGLRPKPDFMVGISDTAFTPEEQEKLWAAHTSVTPTMFPEFLYFPFLVCEVRDRNCPIEDAEREAMYGASIATRAVVELFRKVSATAEVHRKVLAFSVVHNHARVAIFAHFASIDGEKTSFFRRSLLDISLVGDLNSVPWTKPYEMTRAIYEHFFPIHFDRIRSVLSRMRPPSSQEDSPPSVVRLQEEVDRLREELRKSQQA